MQLNLAPDSHTSQCLWTPEASVGSAGSDQGTFKGSSARKPADTTDTGPHRPGNERRDVSLVSWIFPQPSLEETRRPGAAGDETGTRGSGTGEGSLEPFFVHHGKPPPSCTHMHGAASSRETSGMACLAPATSGVWLAGPGTSGTWDRDILGTRTAWVAWDSAGASPWQPPLSPELISRT